MPDEKNILQITTKQNKTNQGTERLNNWLEIIQVKVVQDLIKPVWLQRPYSWLVYYTKMF